MQYTKICRTAQICTVKPGLSLYHFYSFLPFSLPEPFSGAGAAFLQKNGSGKENGVNIRQN